MPYREKEIEKLYYSISEVAAMFDVNTSLIRFWEKEFPVLKPRKNKKGNRLFTKEDIDNLRKIYVLVKEKGYTLQGAKEKLKEDKSENRNCTEVISRLEEIRKTLIDLRDSISLPIAKPIDKPVTLAKKLLEVRENNRDNKNEEISPNQITLF